jgi:hypothetical protein
MTPKRWLKYLADDGIRYAHTARRADADDRDGSDVCEHYHEAAVLAAERGERDLPPLTPRDLSYGAAASAFA